MRPLHAPLPPHPAPALHEVARPRRGARSCTSSASSSASPSSGSTPAWSARAAPIPAQLMYQELADMACERITAAHHPAASSASGRSRPCSIPTTRPAPPATSASTPRKTDRWETDARRCHVNWVVLDSDWEAEFCRVAEAHPQVRAYVKNHNLGLGGAVPLRLRDAQVPARLHRPGR